MRRHQQSFIDPYFGGNPESYASSRRTSSFSGRNKTKQQARRLNQSSSVYAPRPLVKPQTSRSYIVMPPATSSQYVTPSNAGLVYTSPNLAYRTHDGRTIPFLPQGQSRTVQYVTQGFPQSPVIHSPSIQPQLVPVGGFAVHPQPTGYVPMLSYNPTGSVVGYPIQQQQPLVMPMQYTRERSSNSSRGGHGYSGSWVKK